MEDDWRTTRSTIRERGQYMYNNELLSDVRFLAANSRGEKSIALPAHKFVLAISSPVFEAMFYGELAETSSTISLPDCTAEGLLELFRYMYYDEVNLTGIVVMDVLYLAKKYMVPSLADKCNKFLEKELQPEEVFCIFPQAMKLGDDNMRRACWDIVDKETVRAVTSDAFLDVTQDTLCDILDRDTLEINEVQLFQALNHWAENKQEPGVCMPPKRDVLGDKIIQLIRFPLMSISEFIDVVLPAKILNVNEVTEMMTLFHHYGSQEIPPSVTSFKAEKRVGLPVVHDICKRFTNCQSNRWDYTQNAKDSIIFVTDQYIYLTGLRLYGRSDHNNYNLYTVKVAIYKDGLLQAIQQINKGTGQIDPRYLGLIIEFDKPVFIFPHTEYIVEASIIGPASYHGDNGKAIVKCKNVTFEFKDGDDKTRTTTTRGQFPALTFYQYYKEIK